MALGPNAITQLSKLVTGIPAVLRKLPTIAKDPIRMFGELASAKVIAKLEKQATDAAAAGSAYVNTRRGELNQQLASGELSVERHRDKIARLDVPAVPVMTPEEAKAQIDAIIDAKMEELKPTILPALAPISTLFGFAVPFIQLADFMKNAVLPDGSVSNISLGAGSSAGGGAGSGDGEGEGGGEGGGDGVM